MAVEKFDPSRLDCYSQLASDLLGHMGPLFDSDTAEHVLARALGPMARELEQLRKQVAALETKNEKLIELICSDKTPIEMRAEADHTWDGSVFHDLAECEWCRRDDKQRREAAATKGDTGD